MMKNFSICLFSIFILISCSGDEDVKTKANFIGEWELVRMSGQIPGSETAGEEMEWQETYILRANGSFTKMRVEGGETFVAEGTYILNDENFNYNDDTIAHISMIHNSQNRIVATCYSDRTREELFFPGEAVMISSYNQCDGPGLEYSKKK